jgi:GTPase SAR1 family protein
VWLHLLQILCLMRKVLWLRSTYKKPVSNYSTIWCLPFDNLVNTQIWDTAGVPRFRVITESFFNTSFKIAAVCVAFDQRLYWTGEESVTCWVKTWYQACCQKEWSVRVSFRCTLTCRLAKLYNIPYHELSALNDDNINEFKKYFGNLIYEVAMEEQRVNLLY